MSDKPDHAMEIDDLLQMLWVKNYPILIERLTSIRNTKDMLNESSLDDRARKAGEEAAHKLAGILGTFGLPHGSVLASKIEALLAGDASTCVRRAGELSSWVQELEAVIASRT
ncbi:MAG: Hpt domain-containing protein [Silvibacterium sp.]|nr:Hpt domain-containing protein [Silvibacterium sp.]MBV8438706.1 Hpt domain-containing protein [Silvibacterium sp.]